MLNPSVLVVEPAGATIGVIEQLREWRSKWLLADGYTESIGDDLMILGTESENISPDALLAEMKNAPIGAYTTRFDFSKQGQDALRVEFRPAGTETWQLAETLTASPGEHTVTPTIPGQPVSVEYRCRLIRKNSQVGQWSPIYTVFVTP